MITLLELANVFRISAFVLYVCMTFEKRILFFRNDRIYFLSICILGGLGFFPMIFQILPFVNWLGVQGILSVFLGIVFLAIAAYSIRKWRDKNYDGYNYLAAVLLFIMIIQWFLLTSASNT